MKGLNLIAAAVILLSAPAAHAQNLERQVDDPRIRIYTADLSTGVTGETFDCYQKRSRFRGLFATDDEKKHRSMALVAAREAIGQGYNWAVLTPLQFVTDNYQSSQTRWESVGTSLGIGPVGAVITDVIAPVTRTSRSSRARYFLGCTAVDDFDAYRIMWNDHPLYTPADGEQLVDLRSLETTLGRELEGSRYRAPPSARERISDIHYRRPGDRERITNQLAAMRGAAACRSQHRTIDPRSLRYRPIGPGEARAENACLEQFRAAAVMSGWKGFPLTAADTTTDIADRGFLLIDSAIEPGAGKGSGIAPLDTAKWGSAAERPEFALTGPGMGDVFAVFEKNPHGEPRTTILVASNTLSREKLLEVAVFLGSGEWLGDEYNGVSFRDITGEPFRSQFDFRTEQMSDRSPERREKVSDREQANVFSKAAFRAFEDYRNVIIVWAYRVVADHPCDPRAIACADKLQAYNRLGPGVVGSRFKPLQIPPEYDAYIPR